MTAQKNEEIGRVQCFTCDGDSSVRRDKGGRLYYKCNDCGVVNPKGPKFQERMEAAVSYHDGHGPEVASEEPAEDDQGESEASGQPTPARESDQGPIGSLINWLNSGV